MADQRTLEDRNRSAVIRKWAADEGLDIAAKGRIPPGIIAAYEAAHPGQVLDTGQVDWDRAAQELGETTDPLAGLEAELAAAPEGEPGTPPPASLDEARERAGTGRRRRRPSWAGADQGTPRPAVRVAASVQRDIEGKLALLLSVPVGAWEMADPHCGGAMARATPETIRALTPLICQSPGAVAFFQKGTTWMLWLGLANALRPVASAVYEHHLSPEARKRQEAGREGGFQVEPAQAQPDLSAYSTVVTGHVPQPRPA
jgi:Lsr2